MPFSNNIVNNYQLNSGNTPLLYPVRVICLAGVTTGISFPDQFLGRAISLKITIFIFKVRININYKIVVYIDKDSLKDDFKMN